MLVSTNTVSAVLVQWDIWTKWWFLHFTCYH